MSRLNQNQLLIKKLYKSILVPRIIEERMIRLLRQGKISKWFSGIGQEAISVGATLALKSNDTIFTMHRNLGVFTSRNVNLDNLFGQLLGKVTGFTKGRDRTFHFGAPEYHIIGMISHLAAMLPVSCGTALSYKLKKQNRVALAFVGDGATSEGDFHEAINLAAVWKLPVIFLIENNAYGLSTPVSEQYACKNLSDRAIGYGIKGLTIDGNNIEEVYKTINEQANIIRKDNQPLIIEAKTFRIKGHEEASGIKYVPKKLIEKWIKRDPIEKIKAKVLNQKILQKKELELIEKEIKNKIDISIQNALSANLPISSKTEELHDVYAPSNYTSINHKNKFHELRFIDAIKEALYQSMEKDSKIIIMGQDIAEYGGVFKVTEGFLEAFGKERVRNTPITESAAIGSCLGLSLEDFKPVIEMQFADFISCGINQVINNLAKTHYRWNQQVNVTIRMPSGGGVNAGPFHSQNLESLFMHIPGLKIVYPSSPLEAKGLLISSLNDPNPVLFFEHKYLYRTQKESIPKDLYTLEIGKANIVKKGNDLTVITYGLGVVWVKELFQKLDKENISIELIDLITLSPWDKETVYNSIKKTSRVLIVHEANITGGVGAELSATINQDLFEYLDAPVHRLGSLDIPTPFNDKLEQEIFWTKSEIFKTIQNITNY
ncbi:MAG: dehydrogenase [Pelagibacteraceae bacterium TMED237]|nr:dehydrogenase [Candidatus Neomarinimicrobiota bacterium]OUW95033.1 MAG: dehydrogenase [Pelagibacteraceae bacterium TMED237]|tara:strand:- start:3620 stop:5599 length:1980 start_codon:yes stop_codon:yes gene_type:complete